MSRVRQLGSMTAKGGLAATSASFPASVLPLLGRGMVTVCKELEPTPPSPGEMRASRALHTLRNHTRDEGSKWLLSRSAWKKRQKRETNQQMQEMKCKSALLRGYHTSAHATLSCSYYRFLNRTFWESVQTLVLGCECFQNRIWQSITQRFLLLPSRLQAGGKKKDTETSVV